MRTTEVLSRNCRSCDGRGVASQSLERLEARLALAAGGAEGAMMPFRLFYPEGFAGVTITEFLPIHNPGTESADFQVWARFETGERDLLLSQGTLGPGTRGGITVSSASNPAVNLVPQGRPYALEVISSQPLAANLSHYDFQAATGEAFTDTPATEWSFADASRGAGLFNFLVWQNTTEIDATITVEFLVGGQQRIESVVTTTGALRRGGLDLSILAVNNLPAEASFGLHISSDQPIVAGLTRYDTRGLKRIGSTELGVRDDGETDGALVQGSLVNLAFESVAFLNTTVTDVTVALTFVPRTPGEGGFQRFVTVPSGRRVDYNLGQLPELRQTDFYSVFYRSSGDIVARSLHHEFDDDLRTYNAGFAATEWVIADGFMDAARAGRDLYETIGIFNPPRELLEPTLVTVTFQFTDGFQLPLNFSISQGFHFYIPTNELRALLAQSTFGRFFYGIKVTSSLPVVVQQWHYDLTLGTGIPTGGFGTLGMPMGPLTPLEFPVL